MTLIVNIWLFFFAKLKIVARSRVLFRTLVLSLFIYAQAASASHEHKHDDEPHQTICEFCVLTLNDEDIWALDDDVLDEPGFLNLPAVVLLAPVTGLNLCVNTQFDSRVKSLRTDQRWDPVRAPPI